MGIALAPEHSDDLEQLLKKADLALYRSKTMGRNSYTVYDDAMSAELEARNTLESDLRDAIARCQFELHYQPFFDVVSGERRGLEALVRWRHPVKGLIPPDQFIPLAEETGLIVPLGEWATRQARRRRHVTCLILEVAVNLSPVQFKHEELFDHPVRAAGFRPRARAARTRNHRIRAAGTRRREPRLRRKAEKHRHFARPRRFRHRLFVAQHLRELPFDKIKIDKSFIRELTSCRKPSAIISIRDARAWAHRFAEGVETPEQFERLKALGVDFAQGYLLGRPLPIGELGDQTLTVASPQVDANAA